MKRKLLMAVATVALTFLIFPNAALLAQASAPNQTDLVVEKASKYTFVETVDRLTAEAKERAWNIPVIHDLQKSLAKAGKNVNPVTVIEICKPEYSGQILELNYERMISVMMPCRISVYEKTDGKTYVSLIDGAAMAKNMPENIKNVMIAASDEIFEIVKKVTD